MKNVIENIKEISKKPNGNAIMFFGFYLVFFIILFLVIKGTGNRDRLLQEYEKGDTSLSNFNGILSKNYMFDYKVNIDGVTYDYYGKRNEDVYSFKFNGNDYYIGNDVVLVNKGTWLRCDNPFISVISINEDNFMDIINSASYDSKTEYEDGRVNYNLLISTNTLNKIINNRDTDYDEVPNSLIISTDKDNKVNKIELKLNKFYCEDSMACNNSIDLEVSFDMFGSVGEIDNPVS